MEKSSRRQFLGRLAPLGLAVLAGEAAVPSALSGQVVIGEKPPDERLCLRKFMLAKKESLQTRSMGEVMVAVGTSFIGTPYVAHTLEQPGEEHLVVNLRGLDCVTFVENTLALSQCIKLGQHSFEEYKQQLQRLRYRKGVIDGYPSRLHYFSDWIDDNETKKVVRNVTREAGGVPFEKKLSFMSSHPSAYRQMGYPAIREKVRETESMINTRRHFYIRKQQLHDVEKKIEAGDIIGITTSIEGLDIIHTGLAVRANGVLRYLHAPLSKGTVQITEQSLVDYLMGHEKYTGVMVARPQEPGA